MIEARLGRVRGGTGIVDLAPLTVRAHPYDVDPLLKCHRHLIATPLPSAIERGNLS
jgi:hypothetical protein